MNFNKFNQMLSKKLPLEKSNIFSFLPHAHEDCHDKGIDAEVNKKDYGKKKVSLPKGVVDATNHQKERHDIGQGTVHRQTGGHEEMVDMRLVGMENVVTGEPTLEEDTHHVHDRNQQQGDGNEHLFLAAVHRSYGAHETLDAHIGADVAEEKAARIAHEYLIAAHPAEHVEAPEHNQRTHDGSVKRGYHGMPALHEDIGVGRENEDTETRSKAVDAVDEVDGVDNGHDEYHREWIAHPDGYLVQTEDAVHIGDEKSAERKE